MDGNHFRISIDLNRKMQFDRMDMLYSAHGIIFKEAIIEIFRKKINIVLKPIFKPKIDRWVVNLCFKYFRFSRISEVTSLKLALDRSGPPENNFVKSDLFCIVDICYYL